MVMVGCAAPLQTKNKLCEKTLCIVNDLSSVHIHIWIILKVPLGNWRTDWPAKIFAPQETRALSWLRTKSGGRRGWVAGIQLVPDLVSEDDNDKMHSVIIFPLYPGSCSGLLPGYKIKMECWNFYPTWNRNKVKIAFGCHQMRRRDLINHELEEKCWTLSIGFD